MADIRDFTGKNRQFTGDFTGIPTGTTAERPANAQLGYIRFNTDLGFLEQYSANGWTSIAAPPQVGGASPSTVNQDDATQTVVITGSNFEATVIVTVLGNSGAQYPTSSVSRDSSTQITITFTGANRLQQSDEPYDIRVQNGTGLSSILGDAIDVEAAPVFSTATNLGTVFEGQALSNLSVTDTVQATDPDNAGAVTYAFSNAAGQGSNYGSGNIVGASINSSTGQISGTAPSVASDTVQNITIIATDTAGKIGAKDFTFTSRNNAAPSFTNVTNNQTFNFNTMASFSTDIDASDAVHGVSISAPSGGLPSGLSIASNGVVSGTVDWSTLNGAWSTNYPTTIRATDTTLGDFTDITLNFTPANSYYYRQVYSWGYIIGGYINSNPWRAAHRVQFSNNSYTGLGDRCNRPGAYFSGSHSDTHLYGYGMQGMGAASYVCGFNMYSESESQNGNMPVNKDDAGTMSNHGGYVGTPANYTTTGNNTNTVKHTFSNNSYSQVQGNNASNNYGNAFEDDTRGYECYGAQFFNFSNETYSGGMSRPGGSNQAHSKSMSTKQGFALVEDAGNSSSNFTRYNYSNNTNQGSYTSKPQTCGETNFMEVQEWGYGGGCCGSSCQNGWFWYQHYTNGSRNFLGNFDRGMSSGDGGSRTA